MLNALSSRFKSGRLSLGSRSLALLWLALVLLCAGLLAKQWFGSSAVPLETNIMKLLPVNQQNPLAEQAFERVSEQLSDNVMWVLTAPTHEQLHQAVTEMEQALNASGYFSHVSGKIDADAQSAWGSYYFSQRFQQLSAEQRARLSTSPELQVERVVQALYNPFSGVTGQELTQDPFLLFREYLADVQQRSSDFQLKDDYLSVEHQGQTYLMLNARLKGSPYSLDTQQAVGYLGTLHQQLAERYQATTHATGVLFYAEFGTRSAKAEISTIGVFSLLGVVVILVAVFRSGLPLLLALLSIGVGIMVALALTTAIFGRIHLFSLAFGASLIGVSIDYAFHFLTDRLAQGPKWHSRTALRHLWVAITLGLLTSLIGYLGMLIAPFPGLQQLAIFSSLGLIGAYATVVAWYPLLAKKPLAQARQPGATLGRLWLQCWQHRGVRWGLPSILLALGLFTLPNLRYDDDIRQLQAMPDALKQAEQFISQVAGVQMTQELLVVNADSPQALLARLERLEPTLEQWQQQGLLQSHLSLTQFIASRARQADDHQLIADLYREQGALLAQRLSLKQLPALPNAWQATSLEQFLNSPVSEPTRFLYLGELELGSSGVGSPDEGELAKQYAAVVVLHHVSDPKPIRAFSAQHDDVSYLNKAHEVSVLFGEYRSKVLELLALATVLIAAVLVWRYGYRHALRILAPCVIAGLMGIAVTVWLGSSLNLFNLVALVLILGIGIDYTLFFAEQSHSESTLLAITLSALTTILSFGLLALSDTHAIHSFGITVFCGIAVAWLLAPMAMRSNIAHSNIARSHTASSHMASSHTASDSDAQPIHTQGTEG